MLSRSFHATFWGSLTAHDPIFSERTPQELQAHAEFLNMHVGHDPRVLRSAQALYGGRTWVGTVDGHRTVINAAMSGRLGSGGSFVESSSGRRSLRPSSCICPPCKAWIWILEAARAAPSRSTSRIVYLFSIRRRQIWHRFTCPSPLRARCSSVGSSSPWACTMGRTRTAYRRWYPYYVLQHVLDVHAHQLKY